MRRLRASQAQNQRRAANFLRPGYCAKRRSGPQNGATCQAQETARVDSRTTSSGASSRCRAGDSRSSMAALTASKMMPTAALPSASIGWRTVVSEGTERPAGITSSKPITEQSSGNFIPARARQRITPKAVMSSKAITAVKRFLCLRNSSVSFKPPSTGIGIEGIGQIEDERGIDLQVHGTGEGAHATPARRTVTEHFGTADESDLAVAERMQMFQGEMRAGFVIYHDGADGAGTQLAANHDGGDVAFFHVGEEVYIHEEPVGDDDERFDGTREEHFEIALEAAALIVHVGEDGEVGSLVQSVFDAAEDQVQ